VLELSIGKELEAVSLFLKTGFEQKIGPYDRLLWKTIEVSHMDDDIVFLRRLTKPPFRKASLKRHLASFKTSFRPPSGPGVLTF
jgi:hypothetical protein